MKSDITFVIPYRACDHPSFPEGILFRMLNAVGFKISILDTPIWQDDSSIQAISPPRLFFAIIAGPVDSQILNFTSTHKRRKEDLYQDNGNPFFPESKRSISSKIRPDRSIITIANVLRRVFPESIIIAGGVEASLRRFSHYDYISNQIRRPILLDARIDLLVHGPGEKAIIKLAQHVEKYGNLSSFSHLGICSVAYRESLPIQYKLLPSHELVLEQPSALMEIATLIENINLQELPLVQPVANRFIVSFPPDSISSKELDYIYNLPYSRQHFLLGTPTPALRMNLFSITSHRGCSGGCSFCSIVAQNGNRIVSRSRESILSEVDQLKKHPQWTGVISDVGGASAGMYGGDCSYSDCKRISCLFPKPCFLRLGLENFMKLLNDCSNVSGVKKVFISSGIRFDMLVSQTDILQEILERYTGNFFRFAPEHTTSSVLRLMRKPDFEQIERFLSAFNKVGRYLKKDITAIPYLIIGHPGEAESDIQDMIYKLKKLGIRKADVQIFTPSPGTISTAMYWCGQNEQGEEIYVEKNMNELIRRQKKLIDGIR